MVKIIAIIITLFFSYKIFKKTGYRRLLWVFGGLLLLNDMIVLIHTPSFPASRWLVFSLMLSEIIRYKHFKSNIISFPLYVPFIIAFMGLFCIGIFDNRLSLFQRFYQPFSNITSSFFIILLGYISLRNIRDIDHITKYLIRILLVIFLYGLFNFLTKTNPYYDIIANSFISSKVFLERVLQPLVAFEDRYKVSSTMSLSFNYGYVSILLCLLSLYAYFNKVDKNRWTMMGIIAGLGGVILSASRTVMGTLVVGIMIFILLAYNIKMKLQILFFVFILGIISFTAIPLVQERIAALSDIFITGGENTSGSSIDMRNTQLLESLKLFYHNPILGNGYGYISNELEYNNRSDNFASNSDYMGFESYLFGLLIEQGIIGILSALIIFISLLLYFLHNIGNFQKLSSLGVAYIASFLFFSLATGVLGAWPITMLLLGIIIKSIELNKRTNYAPTNSNNSKL